MTELIATNLKTIASFETLLHAGLRGTHLLFTTGMIREAFQRRESVFSEVGGELTQKVQEAVAELITRETLEDRKAWVASLELPVRDVIIQLYFGVLDQYYFARHRPGSIH